MTTLYRYDHHPVPEQRPYGRFYWLAEGLAGGFYPGSTNPADRDLKISRLQAHGIRTIIDLTEAKEDLEPYDHRLKELAPEIKYHRHEIVDVNIPTEAKMEAILNTIDACLQQGPVYVHCWGGLGRTGTVLGCWLVRHGHEAQAALDYLERCREKQDEHYWDPSPQTPTQVKFVLNWSHGR